MRSISAFESHFGTLLPEAAEAVARTQIREFKISHFLAITAEFMGIIDNVKASRFSGWEDLFLKYSSLYSAYNSD